MRIYKDRTFITDPLFFIAQKLKSLVKSKLNRLCKSGFKESEINQFDQLSSWKILLQYSARSVLDTVSKFFMVICSSNEQNTEEHFRSIFFALRKAAICYVLADTKIQCNIG